MNEQLPYNHDYVMSLGIGFAGECRTGIVNPSKDSGYSEEEWNGLTRKEQESWLDEDTRYWADNYIDIGWSMEGDRP